jgi:twinkle protein
MEKIITSKGVLDIHIPASATTTSTGEYYTVCPICSSHRKPEHQNEKIFAVNLHKIPRVWRCNHCGEGGHVIDEAYMARATIKPIIENKAFNPVSDILAGWFLNERAISKQTLLDLDVTSSMESIKQTKRVEGEEDLYDQWILKRCINFKYKKDGILINVKYRDKNKNFKMITGATKILYNIDSIKDQNKAVIVEGEMDVLSFHEAGVKAVVSVPNGTTITQAEIDEYQKTNKFRENLNMEYLDLCIEDFSKITTIYLATDDDMPGQKLREELSRRLGKNRCRFIRFSEYKKADGTPCKDANDVLKYHGKTVLLNTLGNSYPYPMEGVTTAKDYKERMEKIFDNGRQKGFSTGYRSLDPHFNWMYGWLHLANGYAGEGKSSFLFNMLVITTVLYGWKWGMYCPENYPPENIIDTLIEILVGDTADIKWKDRMSKDRYMNALDHIQKHFFFVDNEKGYSPKALREIKKNLITQHGINGFLTDPWKNLYHDHNNDGVDIYLARELAAEVRLAVHNDLINIISHHPPTPPRDKDKNYAAPSYFELVGGQIWSASSYAMLCIHKHDRVTWQNTTAEIHVQKIKDQKLAGIPTDRNNPVLLKFDRRSGRFYEREDVLDLDSSYTVYPFKDYIGNSQAVFDGF